MKNLEKNLLMSAMPFVRDEFIAEASPLAAVPMGHLRRRMLLRWGSVAAGFCLALAVAWLVIPRGDTPDGPPALLPPAAETSLGKDTDPSEDTLHSVETEFPEETVPVIENDETNPGVDPPETTPTIEVETTPPWVMPPIPTFENPLCSAYELYANWFFGLTDGVSTNNYTEYHTAIGQPPELNEIPQTAAVYSWRTVENPPEEIVDQSDAFVENVLGRYAAAAGFPASTITVTKNPYIYDIYGYSWNEESRTHYGYFRANDYCEYAEFYENMFVDEWTASLNGIPLTVDTTMPPSEIEEAMEPLKEVLFDIFGVEFTDVKVTVSAEWNSVNVLYYNQADHPFCQPDHPLYGISHPYIDGIRHPYFNFIRIEFNKRSTGSDNDRFVPCKQIVYSHYHDHTPTVELESRELRLISLEEAEALLNAGCVFGNHVCITCMRNQEGVDFEDYDYVGFDYLTKTIDGVDYALPFYTFYKKIDSGSNYDTYAKTHVAAFEVSGYKDYLRAMKSEH